MFAEPITAVIATRDRGKAIDAAAQSILANRHPALRLVVVDQSRDDASESALLGLRSDPRLTYLRSDTIGLSRARNIGLRLAETELVAFTDDDCEVSHDWLQKLQSVFEQHPEVAVVFCSVRPGPHDQTVGFIPSYECRGTRVIHTIAEKPRARGIGAGMAVRRQPVLVLGGFDEQLGAGARFPAGEDGDIAVRSLIGRGMRQAIARRLLVIRPRTGLRIVRGGALRAHGRSHASPPPAGHGSWRPLLARLRAGNRRPLRSR